MGLLVIEAQAGVTVVLVTPFLHVAGVRVAVSEVGVGLIVIVNICVVPAQLFAEGVTMIVATLGVEPVLMAAMAKNKQ